METIIVKEKPTPRQYSTAVYVRPEDGAHRRAVVVRIHADGETLDMLDVEDKQEYFNVPKHLRTEEPRLHSWHHYTVPKP